MQWPDTRRTRAHRSRHDGGGEWAESKVAEASQIFRFSRYLTSVNFSIHQGNFAKQWHNSVSKGVTLDQHVRISQQATGEEQISVVDLKFGIADAIPSLCSYRFPGRGRCDSPQRSHGWWHRKGQANQQTVLPRSSMKAAQAVSVPFPGLKSAWNGSRSSVLSKKTWRYYSAPMNSSTLPKNGIFETGL